jgi:hypothetical protein
MSYETHNKRIQVKEVVTSITNLDNNVIKAMVIDAEGKERDVLTELHNLCIRLKGGNHARVAFR